MAKPGLRGKDALSGYEVTLRLASELTVTRADDPNVAVSRPPVARLNALALQVERG